MIQIGSMLYVIDNSGVKWVRCISFVWKKKTNYLFFGNLFKAVMRRFRRYRRQLKNPIIKRCQCWALLISTKKKMLNETFNCYLRWNKTYVVLFNFRGKPLGSRILTAVPAMLRYLGLARFITLSAGVIES